MFFVFPVLILLVIFMFVYDADFTTIFYEKYGTDIQTFYKDKVVWITGASTGIGAALALEAAKNGSKVVLSARNEKLLNTVRSKCIEGGAKESDILVLPLDMCQMQEHDTAYKKVIRAFGSLDIMVHNAGRSQRARFEHTDMEVDRSLFELNVFSVINLTRVILPDMLKAKKGTIAVMSSSAGKGGAPFSGSYTGSKHALHGYFECLRSEKVGSGLDICMLCPGPTFSNLLQVAATEKPDESYGEDMGKDDKRMTAERCAQLSLVAIANKIPESWICFAPVLPMMYATQYLPSLSKAALKMLGPKFLAKVRDSRNAMESDKYK